MSIWLSVHKEVLLQNNIFSHNNSLTPADMRQHYLWGLPFLVSKIYYFEVRCSFVVIKILLCRSREMKQGCRLARLFGKSIRDFYARNQYFLMNTQPLVSLFYSQFILQSAYSQFRKYFLINSWTFYIIKIDTNAKTDFYERVNYVQYSCCWWWSSSERGGY